jgi:hypothetical protein
MLRAFVLAGALAGSAEAFTAKPVEAAAEYVVNPLALADAAAHAVRGVVTSIGATSLVLRTTTSKPIDLTFVLTPSTLREGSIAIGSIVSVRYRTEGDSRVAIAVTVRVPKLVVDSRDLTVDSNHLRS